MEPLLIFPDPPPAPLGQALDLAGYPWKAANSAEAATRFEPEDGWAGARPDLHGVRAAEVPGHPSRQGLHPGNAALTGVGIRLLRRGPHGRRPYPAAPGQAGRGARAFDPDGPVSRLPLRAVPVRPVAPGRAYLFSSMSSLPSWVASPFSRRK